VLQVEKEQNEVGQKERKRKGGPLAKYSQQGFEAANKRDLYNFHSHTSQCGGRITKTKKDNMSTQQQKDHLTLRTYSSLLVQPYLHKQNCKTILEAAEDEERKRNKRVKSNAKRVEKKKKKKGKTMPTTIIK